MFSVSNNIITKPRNRLLPDTVKKLILLKSWKVKELTELEGDLQLNNNEESEDKD